MAVFVLLFHLLHSPYCSASLTDDFRMLSELKQNFQFPESSLITWNLSNPSSVCSWAGIRCSRDRVVAMDLTDLNLHGSVSFQISRLDQLTHLSLAGNWFSGTIRITGTNHLQYLNISNNRFSNELQLNYSSLSNLEVLDAYNNNLTDLLPYGVSSLKKLKHLDLGGNFFHGSIPRNYGNLAELEYLSLAGNDLRGKIPAELGNLTNLRTIFLGYYNSFDGGIPVEFGKMTNLRYADLSGCELDGEIPHELGNLKLLETLYLYFNRLSGKIPEELGNLTSLIDLDLSNNALAGEIPFSFINLRHVKLFNLFMNSLSGTIPGFTGDMPDLETFSLWMNNFTGVIPARLGLNGKLWNVDLSSNQLTGRIPDDLCSSNQLRILILMKNSLSGPIPERLGSCYSLVRVRLGDNYLNGSVPIGLIYLPRLNLLELKNNNLTGSLPENRNDSIKPVELAQFDVSNNQILGNLPLSLSNCSSLQILLLARNQFSGHIPPYIGELRRVLKLDLHQNFLSGPIPPQLGACSHLTFLDLSQNRLSGPIPDQISNVHVLNYMNISRNYLNQTIPKFFASMKSLTVVDFSFNNFSGEIPHFGQFTIFNMSSFGGNPRLCSPRFHIACNSTSSKNPKSNPSASMKILILLVLVTSLLLLTIVIICKSKLKKKKSQHSWKLKSFQNHQFTVGDILECIKDENIIGRGGSGVVFHGEIPTGEQIAIKKILPLGVKSKIHHQFKAEIETLAKIRHRNIVRLLAFCSNGDTNLLVFEYMKNGSLGELLHGRSGSGASLHWDLRYSIAIDSAKGLCYLHHDIYPMIVHRDVKSNNILLDCSLEAHVADFGLAKFFINGDSHSMSAVAGSYGYIAPEYAYTLRVDEKSDVYSYGVVLLELVTGRRPVGDFGDGVDIVQWCREVKLSCRGDPMRVVDPRLEVVPKEEATHLFLVAMLCVEENSIERPTMREVVQMLSEFPRPSPHSDRRSSPGSFQEL